MSVRQQKLERIERKIRAVHESELREPKGPKRLLKRGFRYLLMLFHEATHNDVQIRAESLTFLMMFSVLPLIAGAFLIFNVLAQFGSVQDALSLQLDRLTANIPEEHREVLLGYVVQFKDQYLASLAAKSSTIGIFALAILIWIGLQAFNNIDRTLNHIWSASRERPFLQKLSNFIAVSIIAPLVITAALSIPIIARNLAVTRVIFDELPFLSPLLNYITPGLLVFALFSFLYRFVPVAKIRWKSAVYGALFTTIALQLSNFIMQVYFRFGTNSAYGKLAALPLIGFWMYLGWAIVILGAEVSFLSQNHRSILYRNDREPTFRETEGFLRILIHLHRAYLDGKNPVDLEALRTATQLGGASLGRILRFAANEGLVLSLDGQYALARDLAKIPISELLDRFIPLSSQTHSALTRDWQNGISELIKTFENRSIPDYSAESLRSQKGESK